MTANEDDALEAVIRKLNKLAPLDESDRQAIRTLPFRIGRARSGDCLVREGDRATTCCLLLSGYACRHKTTSEGTRQIVSFHLPGDILDVQHMLLAVADHNIQAITDVAFAVVPIEELKRISKQHLLIGEALWRDALIDASIFREWVLNVGRRDAKSRIAHMLCEFATRRQAAGLGDPERFELPMTQEDIADATGLTPVHVNRMLAALATDGLIARNKRQVEIIDWPRMRRAADFDPIYLHAAA